MRHSPCGMALAWQRLNGVRYTGATIFFDRTVDACAAPDGASLIPPTADLLRRPTPRTEYGIY